jgi:hypothetical protein
MNKVVSCTVSVGQSGAGKYIEHGASTSLIIPPIWPTLAEPCLRAARSDELALSAAICTLSCFFIFYNLMAFRHSTGTLMDEACGCRILLLVKK